MLKKAVIGIVVLAVIGGGVLFVLDRTLFAPTAVSSALPVAPTIAAATKVPQPTAPQATSAPATVAPTTAAEPTQAAPSQDTQLYRIDAAQSEVRYEVDETFFQGNRLATAIGRTKGVAGELQINFAEPAKSQIGDIVIDISQFQSDEGRRDNFIRNNGLESAKYPQATFTTTSIEGLPATVNVGDEVSFTMTGDLTVKQTTRPVTWQVTLKLNDDAISGTATTQIKMSDFGVGPIRLAMLETEDDVKLTFDFVAVKAS